MKNRKGGITSSPNKRITLFDNFIDKKKKEKKFNLPPIPPIKIRIEAPPNFVQKRAVRTFANGNKLRFVFQKQFTKKIY